MGQPLQLDPGATRDTAPHVPRSEGNYESVHLKLERLGINAESEGWLKAVDTGLLLATLRYLIFNVAA